MRQLLSTPSAAGPTLLNGVLVRLRGHPRVGPRERGVVIVNNAGKTSNNDLLLFDYMGALRALMAPPPADARLSHRALEEGVWWRRAQQPTRQTQGASSGDL
jgi:hypothetical protein